VTGMREYKGKGQLVFPNVPTINGNFRLVFEDSGETRLEFSTDSKDAYQLAALPSVPGKFSGDSANPNFKIEIDTLYLGAITLTDLVTCEFKIWHPVRIVYKTLKEESPVKISRSLSNFIFYGTEKIEYQKSWTMGMTRSNINGKEIHLVQLPDFKNTKKHLEMFKDVRITSELRLEGNYGAVTPLREMSENIENLCSLASGNYVAVMYEDLCSGNDLCETTLFPLKTYSFSTDASLIDNSLHGSHEFKIFLETTYAEYLKLRDVLGLPYVIELFTSSKIYSPLQVQYLLATTAFECLERYFRDWRSLKEIPELKGKIARMLGFFSFAITPTELESYRSCRNSVVHEGRFPSTIDGFLATMELRNLVDRFLLFILGYQNKPYFDAVKRTKTLL
jgi:hypothetical protein